MIKLAAITLAVSLLAGCSTPPPILPRVLRMGSYWAGDGMTGAPRVRINLADQRAYFYKGEQLAGVSRISSGSEGRDTVTGDYRILEKRPPSRLLALRRIRGRRWARGAARCEYAHG